MFYLSVVSIIYKFKNIIFVVFVKREHSIIFIFVKCDNKFESFDSVKLSMLRFDSQHCEQALFQCVNYINKNFLHNTEFTALKIKILIELRHSMNLLLRAGNSSCETMASLWRETKYKQAAPK